MEKISISDIISIKDNNLWWGGNGVGNLLEKNLIMQ
jgi:hypothetical protein